MTYWIASAVWLGSVALSCYAEYDVEGELGLADIIGYLLVGPIGLLVMLIHALATAPPIIVFKRKPPKFSPSGTWAVPPGVSSIQVIGRGGGVGHGAGSGALGPEEYYRGDKPKKTKRKNKKRRKKSK